MNSKSALQIRREMCEALDRGPSTLDTYSAASIWLALDEGLIIITGATGGRYIYALNRVNNHDVARPAALREHVRRVQAAGDDAVTAGTLTVADIWAELEALALASRWGCVDRCPFEIVARDWDAAHETASAR